MHQETFRSGSEGSSSSRTNSLYELAYGILDRWSQWQGRRGGIAVVQDLVQNARAHKARQVAFQRADVSYYMYVCGLIIIFMLFSDLSDQARQRMCCLNVPQVYAVQ